MNELVDSTLARWLPGIAGSADYELAARILRAYSAMPVEEIAQRHLDYRFEGFSPEMLKRAQEMLSPAAKPLLSVFPQYAAKSQQDAYTSSLTARESLE